MKCSIFNEGDERTNSSKQIYCFSICKPMTAVNTCWCSVQRGCVWTEPVLQGLKCQGSKLTLECPNNYRIHATSAFFGRQDEVTCSDQAVILTNNCSSSSALGVVSQLCEAKSNCDVYAVTSLLGDPCAGTYKYLEVSYTCYSQYIQTSS